MPPGARTRAISADAACGLAMWNSVPKSMMTSKAPSSNGIRRTSAAQSSAVVPCSRRFAAASARSSGSMSRPTSRRGSHSRSRTGNATPRPHPTSRIRAPLGMPSARTIAGISNCDWRLLRPSSLGNGWYSVLATWTSLSLVFITASVGLLTIGL